MAISAGRAHPELYDAFQDRARGPGIGQERMYHVDDAEEAFGMVCRVGATAFLSLRGATIASEDGVAL